MVKKTFSSNTLTKTKQEGRFWAAKFTELLDGDTIAKFSGVDDRWGIPLGVIDDSGQLSIDDVTVNTVQETIHGITIPALTGLKFSVQGGVAERTYYVQARIQSNVGEVIEMQCRIRIDDNPVVFGN